MSVGLVLDYWCWIVVMAPIGARSFLDPSQTQSVRMIHKFKMLYRDVRP